MSIYFKYDLICDDSHNGAFSGRILSCKSSLDGFMMLLLVEYDTIPSPANMCDYDTWLFMVSEIISRPLCFATDIARM